VKIACVTLSRNQGLYIREAILSVLAQGTDTDYLVYDVSSSDQTSEVLAELRNEKLSILSVPQDDGPADGLNRSLAQIDGELFYYLNADDRVIPGAFRFAVAYFQEHPSCDILHGSINLINQDGSIRRVLPAMPFSIRGYAWGSSVVYQQATFIRRSALSEAPFNVANTICWDGELVLSLAQHGAIIHRTPVVLGEFRIHDESLTGSGRARERARLEHMRIFEEIMGRRWKWYDTMLSWMLRIVGRIQRELFLQTKSLP
jgi:glycosyltransferase involved in cell wall biosynthesis